ncbi:MAG: PEP/pyruvate-binding domain-containing protein [Desulfobacterales bacterium]
MPIGGILKKLLRRRAAAPDDAEALRLEFKERYHHFRLLLGANRKALEIMSEIEEALHGHRPFGMTFVRAACTSVCVNVYSMIRGLERLAPGKYTALFARYDAIQKEIEEILARPAPPRDPRLVIPIEDLHRDLADAAGPKMANLGEIRNRLGLRVPPGFAITTAAAERFFAHRELQTEIDRRLQAAETGRLDTLYALSAEIQQLIIRAEIPGEVEEAILQAYAHLEAGCGPGVKVALRSSALGEDAGGSSFAGQYRSELNVGRETLLTAYREVLASKYGLPAITYRLQRGFRDEDIAMGVGCLAMVPAVAGGVAYSCSPVDPRDRRIFIQAVWGLPKAVVDGSTASDLFVLSRNDPPELLVAEVREKDRKYLCFPEEGVCRMELTGPERLQPSLSPEQARELARIALALERHYGCPQDLEWALDENGEVVLLQCRPLTARETAAGTGPSAADGEGGVLCRGGATASPGVAAGPVFVAERAADMLSFPPGAVLVVRQALPRWASLLSRAAAVVAEEGGFAGHLASVAREFGVPALFGVPGAVEKLRGAGEVTVDATGRAVHAGRREALLEAQPPRRPLMQGSPVFRILEEAGRRIVPLHLLDPDALEFAPEHCRTLHDITRFIHEKSVLEMFRFGQDHHFPERSSKQLFHRVPMQWWILNLDDGFTEEVTGPYVRLEQIACAPMLAFWRGFTAIPWEGPPAVDGRGMLSVLFQATTNRSLNLGVRSKFAERNYFMISRSFCCLNQRLGFHFATLEALVSERTLENYLSFQFKGGAADFERRLARVHLVAEILEEQGFQVEIREDHLVARFEGHPEGEILRRIEVLGYLALHTRQMDMVMANAGRVESYRRKYRQDIERLTAGRGA